MSLSIKGYYVFLFAVRAKGKVKMTNDPLFEKIVDEVKDNTFLFVIILISWKQVVADVKVEGGYRKPEWKDLFAVQFFLCPYYFVIYLLKYHRRYISKNVSSMSIVF